MYLYRAVDGQGNTVEFCLSRTRGIAAAKAFFRKALKHHREPHSITLDGHQPSHSALRRMGMNGEFNFRGRNPVKIRCCQYLNNVVEQDHRRVKGRLRPMLGFKTFYNARRVIIGIELAQKIHKRQFAIPITLQSNPAVTWRQSCQHSPHRRGALLNLIAPTILSAPEPLLSGGAVSSCREPASSSSPTPTTTTPGWGPISGTGNARLWCTRRYWRSCVESGISAGF